MTRPGNAASVAGLRRVVRIPALLMLLILLGAAVLVSAGSAHHRPQPTVAGVLNVHNLDHRLAGPVADTEASLPGHAHHHGSDWTPSPTQRLRPATAAAIATAALIHRVSGLDSTTTSLASFGISTAGADLKLLGVLRV
ncbi:hypothetical protein [Actinoplanes rectilineatus]|uniref:hypothetical protein n=1 Tax=Actinoplanes rectilineatus TaxID=113571 RepID=UPI0012F98A47|nr:hypothetical protein [Actinoplanes rectilineatus]